MKHRFSIFSIVITVVFLGSAILAMDTEDSYYRLASSGNEVQVAHKSFINKSTGQRVNLVGMTHHATKNFYEYVSNYIRGHIVLEEGAESFNTREAIRQRAKTMGNEFYNILTVFWGCGPLDVELIDILNRVSQASMDETLYAQAQELILADKDVAVERIGYKDFVELDETRFKEKLFLKVFETFAAFVQAWGKQIVFHPFSRLSDDQVEERAYGLCDRIMYFIMSMQKYKINKDNIGNNIEALEKVLPEITKILLDMAMFDSQRNAFGDSAVKVRESVFEQNRITKSMFESGSCSWLSLPQNNRNRTIYLERNELIYAILRNLWVRPEVNYEISVVYGISHMCFVERFLRENGFELIENSVNWITTSFVGVN